MKLAEAKQSFIENWGTLGSSWGINRTMAQIHALLIISSAPLSAEEIMAELKISRGNANMNLHALMDWSLVERVHKLGERKDYFQADKDVWSMAVKIAQQRRQRELEPVMKLLKELQNVDSKDADPAELKAFTESIGNIEGFAKKADKVLKRFGKSNENWFTNTLLKALK